MDTDHMVKGHPAPSTCTSPAASSLAALEHLATALGPGFVTALGAEPGRPVRLTVISRANYAATDIYADEAGQGGWYWWPWAERIGATGNPQAAAHQVAAALRGAVPGGQR